MNHWGVSAGYTNPPVAKADHRNDTNTQKECHRIVPSSSQASPTIWGNQCGPDDRDCHTHTQPRRTIVPKTVATSLTPAMHQDPTSRRCGHARHRPTPTPRAMHKQHTEPWPSCCVPFGDPHVHKVMPSDKTNQECSHSSANTLGSAHHMVRTHRPTTSPKEGKRRGYISKGFCANADLCPLASPRVALVGVCLLRHPDNGNTR